MDRFDSKDPIRDDASAIWRAGVDAVHPRRLLNDRCSMTLDDSGSLTVVVHDESTTGAAKGRPMRLPLAGNIYVFGGGKAGAAMGAAMEEKLLAAGVSTDRISGWLNVPDGFQQRLQHVHLHAARPLGKNEPTQRAVDGTREILRRVSALQPHDLGICLISGGGSALLCEPVDGVTLEDKQQTTRLLSGLGASIRELNCVRTQLSRVKGGGLANAFRGGTLLTLIISDVLGDPVDIIASGPTVPSSSGRADALRVLEQFDADRSRFPESVVQHLEGHEMDSTAGGPAAETKRQMAVVLGNNDTAVQACQSAARTRGYQVETWPSDISEGTAEQMGARLAAEIDRMLAQGGKRCLISGGEPVVELLPESERGTGGRNQQLVLAAILERLSSPDPEGNFAFLSGGTDGEDGPTDAAGAWFTRQWLQAASISEVDARLHLSNNDAYPFFLRRNGLLKTGPTETNVCDVRVVLTNAPG